MATLFDNLSKKLSASQNEPTLFAPAQGTIADTVRAKSGKGPATTSTPGASNLGEQAAQESGKALVDQQGTLGTLAGMKVTAAADAQQQKTDTAKQQIDAQAQSMAEQRANVSQLAGEQTQATEQMAQSSLSSGESLKIDQLNNTASHQFQQLAAERGLSVDNIFRDFQASNKELDFRRDASQLEQVGFIMAMKDRSYLDEISRVGRERDLNDKLNYTDEMQQLIMGKNLDILLDEMDFKRGLNDTQREWDRRLASVDLDSAMAIATRALKDEANMTMISGANSLAKTGIDAKAQSDSGAYDSDYQSYRNSGGTKNYQGWQSTNAGGKGSNNADYVGNSNTTPVT